MRVTIVTVGSRGDVEPYIALGLGLQSAGHEVRLATHADYETAIRSRGLDFHLRRRWRSSMIWSTSVRRRTQ